MGRDFEFIDHTSDVGIKAYDTGVKEAIEEVEYRDIELTAPDQESLVVEWLNELIDLFDSENIIFKRFDITHLNNTQLTATAYGEKVDRGNGYKFQVLLGI